MNINDFIATLRKYLQALDLSDNPELDILVRVESKLAFASVFDKIAKLEKGVHGTAEANSETLDILINLLRTRWQAIRLTDANYCHSPHSLASRAYLIIAQELAKILKPQKAYDFLLPTVDAANYRNAQGKMLYALQLHEFVFADPPAASRGALPSSRSSKQLTYEQLTTYDVGEPVEVFACLNAASTDPQRLPRKTWARADVGSLPACLNSAEEARIKGHSELASASWVAIKLNQNGQTDSHASLVSLKRALARTQYQPQSSYGADGRAKLLTVIMKLCNNADDLVKTLANHVNPAEWAKFLSKMDHSDLRNYMCKKETIGNAVSGDGVYYQEPQSNAAWLYCFAFIYKDDRTKTIAPYRNTIVPRFGHGLWGTYTRAEKLAGVDLLLQYLAGDRTQTIEQFRENAPCPDGVDRERIKAAMDEGELGKIMHQVRVQLGRQPTSRAVCGYASS